MDKSFKRFQSIAASAGSGKTTTLTNRYIKLLQMGVCPSKIIASTFSNKAAAEIRERVLEVSSKNVLETPSDLSKDQAKDIFNNLITNFSKVKISTYDSFFLSILSSYQYNFGLWGSISIADISDLNKFFLKSIEELSAEAGLRTQLLDLTEEKGKKLFLTSLINLKGIFEFYREVPKESWDIDIETKLEDSYIQSFFEEIAIKINALELPKNKNGKPNTLFKNANQKLIEHLENLNIGEICKSKLITRPINGEYKFSTVEIPEPFLKHYIKIGEIVSVKLLENLKSKTAATRKILSLLSSSYTRYKNLSGILSFQDIVYLISSAEATKRNDLYYKLDSTVDHVLLDEFQDTSLTQWEVLEPICEEILSSANDKSFFVVGDPKQAIYSWRGGDSEILTQIPQKWENVVLEKNNQTYRCSSVVTDLVNTVFGNLEKSKTLHKYPDALSAWNKLFEKHRSLNEDSGYYEFNNSFETKDEKYEYLLSKILEITKNKENQNVAIICRTNKEINEIYSELKQRDPKINIEVNSKKKLIDYIPVTILADLIHFYLYPESTVSLFNAYPTPLKDLFEIDSPLLEKNKLSIIHKKISSSINPLNQFIKTVFETLGVSLFEDPFYELVALSENYSDPAKFLEKLIEFEVDLSSEASISLLTVHKSKGLQFDAVFMPMLDVPIKSKQRNQLLVTQPSPFEKPDYVSCMPKSEVLEFLPKLKAKVEQNINTEVKELLSLVYVSLTRAKKGLYLLSDKESEQKESLYTLFSETLVEKSQGDPNWFNMKSTKEETQEVTELTCKLRKRENLKKYSPNRFRPNISVTEHLKKPILDKISLETTSKDFGTEAHRLMQKIYWIESESKIEETIDNMLTSSTDFKDKIQERVYKMIKENFDLFTQQYYQDLWSTEEIILKTEISITAFSEKNLKTARFDRLCFSKSKNLKPTNAHIIDYKTGSTNASEQLTEYKKMLAKAFYIDFENITAEVLGL